jgi:CRISPR-associated protein Csx14
MTDKTLVITMGGQPQVVTFALDWLLGQGEAIREVVILHLLPRNEPTRRAIEQIVAEFSGDQYQGRPCRLRLVPIRRGQQKLTDIPTEAEAEATWQTVYEMLQTLKDKQSPLHLCVAGGRRMMGLLTLSAAMLLCGHQDRIWHIYTPPEFLEQARGGAILHAPPDAGVRLIQVPIMPWGAYIPALRDLAQPTQVIAAQTAWLDENERSRCRAVFKQLTDRQREALRYFAAGDRPQTVTEQMNITLTTVNTHKSVILAECRNAWNFPDNHRLTYHFIREKFGPYLESLA